MFLHSILCIYIDIFINIPTHFNKVVSIIQHNCMKKSKNVTQGCIKLSFLTLAWKSIHSTQIQIYFEIHIVWSEIPRFLFSEDGCMGALVWDNEREDKKDNLVLMVVSQSVRYRACIGNRILLSPWDEPLCCVQCHVFRKSEHG